MNRRSRQLVVVHGVNLDLLGERPAQHYGTVTLAELEKIVTAGMPTFGLGVPLPADQP